MLLVIEHPSLGDEPRRLVIDSEHLLWHESRGWVPLGETTDPNRDPIRTDVEWAEFYAAEQARIAAFAAPKSDAAPATSRPKK